MTSGSCTCLSQNACGPRLFQRSRVRALAVEKALGVGMGFVPSAIAAPVAAIIMTEPSNALSLPTWIVHTSSVLEWVVAMGLMWKFAEVSGEDRWKGMTWGMMPLLAGAMCACTWHFFYNDPDLEFLVTLQSALTVLGNVTCGIAAYRLCQDDPSKDDGSVQS